MTQLLSALGIPRDRRIVGTVATLRPEKNIARLLQRLCADRGAKCQSAWSSSVTAQSERALKSQALAMGLSDTVIFTGAIEDPARLLGAFDVFAISSDTEQMPISVLEAMAAGLPDRGRRCG